MKRVYDFILILLLLAAICSCDRTDIKCDSLKIVLSDDGMITHLLSGQNTDKEIFAYTTINGCSPVSDVKRSVGKNTIEFERTFQDSLKRSCIVKDRFISTAGSVVWEIEIKGTGEPWSAPIETVVDYPVSEHSAFWTTWSAMEKNPRKWSDPLVIKSFDDLALNYGGSEIMDPNSLIIPLFSIYEKDKNLGYSLVHSLNDTLLDMKLITTKGGNVRFKRENHKISSDHVTRFRMHLFSHAADWRAGLDFCVKMFPEYFRPISPKTHEVAGCGAYSSWEGALDTVKLNKMGFSFNWKATFDFPYMGMFLPEVSSTKERWKRFQQGGIKVGDGYTSIDEMEGYMKRMKDIGYHVLCYFNLTEVGNHIVYPAPKRKAEKDEDLWRDPNDFVYYEMNDALLRRAKSNDDSPVYSNWEGCVVVDPGEGIYQKHLIAQAKRHIEYLPSSSGICIDRLDWLREYNVKGDDGVSWKDDLPARSLLFSWKEAMNKIGPLMHDAGKVIFANVLTARIDILEHIDAVYDEYGQIPLSLNRSAFLTLEKPLIAWTASSQNFYPDPDKYIQRHLYLGAFLTVPFPGNDHTILPDPGIEKYYIDYGEMLQALKGKKWVLTPEVLKVEKGNAKVNIFENASTYIIPIMLGEDDTVILSLKGLQTDYASCKVLYPTGKKESISLTKKDDRVFFDIPLQRGCGMLIINK